MLSQQISTYIWLPQNLHLATGGYRRSWEAQHSIFQPLQKRRQSTRALRWCCSITQSLGAPSVVPPPAPAHPTGCHLPVSDAQSKGVVGSTTAHRDSQFLSPSSHTEGPHFTSGGQARPGTSCASDACPCRVPVKQCTFLTAFSLSTPTSRDVPDGGSTIGRARGEAEVEQSPLVAPTGHAA